MNFKIYSSNLELNNKYIMSTDKAELESRLFVSPIAEPLAGDKLQKKLLKLIKKSMKNKTVRRGVKETVKAIKKDGKG